jgi:hypothetical protein
VASHSAEDSTLPLPTQETLHLAEAATWESFDRSMVTCLLVTLLRRDIETPEDGTNRPPSQRILLGCHPVKCNLVGVASTTFQNSKHSPPFLTGTILARNNAPND